MRAEKQKIYDSRAHISPLFPAGTRGVVPSRGRGRAAPAAVLASAAAAVGRGRALRLGQRHGRGWRADGGGRSSPPLTTATTTAVLPPAAV